jgi:folate-binding protein YgfZ
MSETIRTARLDDRAVVEVSGPDWRGFLQGLLSQDVESLARGEIRYAALLSAPGRLLFDLFVVGQEEGCLLDCAAERREALIRSLTLYRLRAKVAILPREESVWARWNAGAADPPWMTDPRLASLGYRAYAARPPAAVNAAAADLTAHALRLGVPGPADFGVDKTYPIEANFDLLNGIDFHKGCFVGQETTSRMKRRGTLKTRMAPIAFEGPPPAPGADLLCGDLRAGEALSGAQGLAMAALRLDRADGEARTLPDGRPWRPLWPDWMPRAAS